MGYEIDFLPVGEKSKSGDAVALRYGNLHGLRNEQTVIVIDGGYSDNGPEVVDHVRTHFQTGHVDFVVSTHPEQDHIGGLKTVLEELTVGHLLMHLPWSHSSAMAAAKSASFAGASFSESLEASLQRSAELEDIARSKNIPITEPFAGVRTQDGSFRILGPSLSFYEELIGAEVSPPSRSLSELLLKAASGIMSLVPETIQHETLRNDGTTSPQNNSSVISLLDIGGERALFTGDAGIPALERALDVLETEGFQPGGIRNIQIPHHGSRRNVGPDVLDRLLGPKGQTAVHSRAFASVAKLGEPKHPSKKVMNAFTRRGYAVRKTQGRGWRQPYDAPNRPGWEAGGFEPLHPLVEEDGGD